MTLEKVKIFFLSIGLGCLTGLLVHCGDSDFSVQKSDLENSSRKTLDLVCPEGFSLLKAENLGSEGNPERLGQCFQESEPLCGSDYELSMDNDLYSVDLCISTVSPPARPVLCSEGFLIENYTQNRNEAFAYPGGDCRKWADKICLDGFEIVTIENTQKCQEISKE